MNDREPCDYRMQQEFEEAEFCEESASFNESMWHKLNRKLIDEIHEVVETQIKENENVGS